MGVVLGAQLLPRHPLYKEHQVHNLLPLSLSLANIAICDQLMRPTISIVNLQSILGAVVCDIPGMKCCIFLSLASLSSILINFALFISEFAI